MNERGWDIDLLEYIKEENLKTEKEYPERKL
jgi:hypothetical protein